MDSGVEMFSRFRIMAGPSGKRGALMMLAACLVSIGILGAQGDEPPSFFLGKEVTLKIDLPATHKGIDLRFDGRPEPMNWSQYSGRLKRFGISLRRASASQ
jgi:hypothetical protein